MKILIATLSSGTVRNEYLTSMMTETFLHPERLFDQNTFNIAHSLTQGNSGLSKDRSIIASTAVHMDFDKLFFIDSDQSWKFEDFKKLVLSDKEIIGAPIALKRRPITINFTPLERDNDCFKDTGGVPTPKGLQKLFDKYNPDQSKVYREPVNEIEVALLGTGFICIDIKVLKKLVPTSQPFAYIHPSTKQKVTCWEFFPSGAADNFYWGEDWALCRNAKHAGFKVWINASCEVGHHGDGDYYIRDEL